jgi:predicted DNA repair protein MutK
VWRGPWPARDEDPPVPASSLFTLIDDIASVLDDVAVMTKVAAKKTAGVLGDDLALNADQVTGVAADRELPVVWAVFKGSAKNKLVIVPAALAISAVAPWLVTPLLMLGGLFLCFEGFEKVTHKLFHRKEDEAHHEQLVVALANPAVDMVAFEKDRIRGAIRTDIILSAEIIVITLGEVKDKPFGIQVAVVCAIAAAMTIGVYGFVAGIVKLDDVGLSLSRRANSGARALGRAILRAAPYVMKTLSIVGTAAMFLVGGGILVHGIAPLHHLATDLEAKAGVLGLLGPTLVSAIVGLAAGGVALLLVSLAKRLRPKKVDTEQA